MSKDKEPPRYIGIPPKAPSLEEQLQRVAFGATVEETIAESLNRTAMEITGGPIGAMPPPSPGAADSPNAREIRLQAAREAYGIGNGGAPPKPPEQTPTAAAPERPWGEFPKNWREAVPWAIWGIVVTTLGGDALSDLRRGAFFDAAVSGALAVAVAMLAIYWRRLKAWAAGINPNWVVAFLAILVAWAVFTPIQWQPSPNAVVESKPEPPAVKKSFTRAEHAARQKALDEILDLLHGPFTTAYRFGRDLQPNWEFKLATNQGEFRAQIQEFNKRVVDADNDLNRVLDSYRRQFPDIAEGKQWNIQEIKDASSRLVFNLQIAQPATAAHIVFRSELKGWTDAVASLTAWIDERKTFIASLQRELAAAERY